MWELSKKGDGGNFLYSLRPLFGPDQSHELSKLSPEPPQSISDSGFVIDQVSPLLNQAGRRAHFNALRI